MSSTPAPQSEVTFRPERTHLLAAVIMAVIGILATGSAPSPWCWILMGLFLAGVALFCWWALTTSTTVNDSGVTARSAFSSPRTYPWEEITGVSFARSAALLHTKDGQKHKLPVVSFNDLPRLEEASRGRIPDALTMGREAVDEKVRVVYRDGREVLMTREEYEEHQRQERSRTDTPNA